jgi:hypothetical protein
VDYGFRDVVRLALLNLSMKDKQSHL